jgi:hypothetical protein
MLDDAHAQARWSAITGPLEKAIVAESARWGDVRYDRPVTPDDWRAARDDVLAQMEGNGALLLELARNAGYYPAVDPPEIGLQPPGRGAGTVLTMTADTGDIFYTVGGGDPREAGTGRVALAGLPYTRPITLTSPTLVRARTLAGDTWSAMAEISFHREHERGDVRITEIMYNPPDGDDYEFLEIQNMGELAVDLSGAFFEGIEYRFPRYTIIQPEQIMVLVADFKRFRRRYPEPDIHGVFEGKLSDRGETIALRDADGGLITSVTYRDEDGWPLSPDGTGDSLTLFDRGGDPDGPQNWQASSDLFGSPGVVELN